jgi:hypothetical protein
MSRRGDEESVGYGRPPRATRFKPGQSGNPRGRPKGSKGLASVLSRALAEKVTVTENGRRRKITKLEAMTKQLVNKAAGADLAAMKLLVALIQFTENRNEPNRRSTESMNDADKKIIQEFYARLRETEYEKPHRKHEAR